jgi:hypothetical protein
MRVNNRDHTKPYECTYVEEQVDVKLLGYNGHIHAHPIVMYSEILENCDLVHRNVDQVSRKLREVTYKLARELLAHGKCHLHELIEQLNHFIWKHEEYLRQLDRVIGELTMFKCQYESMKCLDDCQRKCYNDVIYNLYRKRKMQNKVVKRIAKVGLALEPLTLVKAVICKKNAFLAEALLHVDKVKHWGGAC